MASLVDTSGQYEAMYKGMSSFRQVGAVVISDDMGFNTQTLISSESLRKHVLPGQLSSIMEDLIDDVGIDAKHSYEDSILPVNGGYALGSGNSIPDYVPLQNYLTMLEIGWQCRA